ncbi:MAG TPA: universal stress protein [Gemmataceae bacterium]|nr:universal stress protein [Gemmataceae bacterium]
MYGTILIPLENSATDEAILTHIRPLARLCKSRLVLVHVADGFGARYQEALNLADSEEVQGDREYLERRRAELAAEGFDVSATLAMGDPTKEVCAAAEREHADLIAMSTHGHRFLQDLLLGSVAEGVRHRTQVPVLLVRASKP